MGMFVLYVIANLISLFFGYRSGYNKGNLRGLSIGSDVEFYLFSSSLEKLKIQSKYINVVQDVKSQYMVEQAALGEHLKSK